MDITVIGRNIAIARKHAGLTQEELADKTGVSAQAVSKWENGRNLPDIENLMRIAEVLNVPYGALFSSGTNAGEGFAVRDRLFHEDNMFTRMRAFAMAEGLTSTYRALQYMRERHAGQLRNPNRFVADRVQYINHPLMMACQAHALGVRDDNLLSAILLHDVVEDTDTGIDELPFDPEVRELVSLVSFSVPDGMTKAEAKAQYFARIAENPKACVIKALDRCSNISTMAACYSAERMARYIDETEQHIIPLLNVLKSGYPQYSDLAFIVKYQIRSVVETVKCLTQG